MRSSEHTNLQFRKLLKLQLGVIGIRYTGHWIGKTEVSHARLRKVEWLKYSQGKSGPSSLPPSVRASVSIHSVSTAGVSH